MQKRKIDFTINQLFISATSALRMQPNVVHRDGGGRSGQQWPYPHTRHHSYIYPPARSLLPGLQERR